MADIEKDSSTASLPLGKRGVVKDMEKGQMKTKERVAIVMEQQMTHMQKKLDEQARATAELSHLPATMSTILDQLSEISKFFADGEVEDLHDDPNPLDSNNANSVEEDGLSDLLQRNSADPSILEGDEGNDEIMNILLSEDKDETVGPPVSAAVSSRFKKTIMTPVSKDSFDKLKLKLLVPENCKELMVPKMNPEIWNPLPSAAKSTDSKLQLAQQVYSKGMIAFAMIADLVTKFSKQLPSEFSEPVLRLCLDAAALQAMGFRETSYKRRSGIRPFLSPQFVNLCNSKVDPGEFLFGDNLQDQVKVTKSVANIMKTDRPFFGKRFTPYQKPQSSSSLNWRGQPRPFPQRGTMNRGWPRFTPRGRGQYNQASSTSNNRNHQ